MDDSENDNSNDSDVPGTDPLKELESIEIDLDTHNPTFKPLKDPGLLK